MRRTINTPVELTDVTATILDVAGLEPATALRKRWPTFHTTVPCRSLMPAVSDQTDRVRDFAFSEMRDWSMVVDDNWKYIRWRSGGLNGVDSETLIDRNADPTETVNHVADPAYAATRDRGRQRLLQLLHSTPAAQLNHLPYRLQANPELAAELDIPIV